jgi:hypothetical protein
MRKEELSSKEFKISIIKKKIISLYKDKILKRLHYNTSKLNQEYFNRLRLAVKRKIKNMLTLKNKNLCKTSIGKIYFLKIQVKAIIAPIKNYKHIKKVTCNQVQLQ